MTAPHYQDASVTLHAGKCEEILATLPDASVDSVVCDPPYELGFMGKGWDGTGIAYSVEMWAECLRVLKPGGHLLAFGGTRTWHRLACAVEDAGFEVRDSIAWLYGSGFPKSLDVSKAIDKRPGVGQHPAFALHLAERREAAGLSRADVSERVVGTRTGACWNWEHHQFPEAKWWPALRDLLALDDAKWGPVIAEAERQKIGTVTHARSGGDDWAKRPGSTSTSRTVDVTASATPAAEQWQGWGTALKPAFEPVVVARKPLVGTVAGNVLTHGTGALNIDACRIGTEERVNPPAGAPGANNYRLQGGDGRDVENARRYAEASKALPPTTVSGRWPANVVLDDTQAAALDEQSGTSKSPTGPVTQGKRRDGSGWDRPVNERHSGEGVGYGDSGGASRFFYVAKAPKSERPSYEKEGERSMFSGSIDKRCTLCGKQRVNVGTSFCTCPEPDFQPDPAKLNKVSHPTVKPLTLMRWLVRLVTPPGGTVLEPFAGSGTTVEACLLEGFRCIAIEKTPEYLPLILARIERQGEPSVADEVTRVTDPETAIAEQLDEPHLFDFDTEDTA